MYCDYCPKKFRKWKTYFFHRYTHKLICTETGEVTKYIFGKMRVAITWIDTAYCKSCKQFSVKNNHFKEVKKPRSEWDMEKIKQLEHRNP